jgi:NADPH-dependent ferric siderophore reductase
MILLISQLLSMACVGSCFCPGLPASSTGLARFTWMRLASRRAAPQVVPVRRHQESPAMNPPHRQPSRVRHELRFRRLQVLARELITPQMLRITVGGPELAGFVSLGYDDHVKLFFPDEHTGELRLPGVDAEGQIVWPAGARAVARDYTPLAYDAEAATLQLAFALHQAGPATRWAQQARPGDWLGVGGPRGSFVQPMAFDGYVLIGDDTALPAIARRLAELPADAPTVVMVEVEDAACEQNLPSRASVSWRWLHRQGRPAHDPSRLLAALQAQEWPAGDLQVWIAAESGVALALRRHWVLERAHPRQWIKAAGYWRAGAEAAYEEHND